MTRLLVHFSNSPDPYCSRQLGINASLLQDAANDHLGGVERPGNGLNGGAGGPSGHVGADDLLLLGGGDSGHCDVRCVFSCFRVTVRFGVLRLWDGGERREEDRSLYFPRFLPRLASSCPVMPRLPRLALRSMHINGANTGMESNIRTQATIVPVMLPYERRIFQRRTITLTGYSLLRTRNSITAPTLFTLQVYSEG